MPKFSWTTDPVPNGLKITQVYGFCFDSLGRVLLLKDETGSFTLPGGKPETCDADIAQTLRREADEEASATLETPVYLGVQQVQEDDGHPHAQVRMIARIKSFGPFKKDIGSSHTYRRYVVPLNKAPASLDWGIDGLLQAADAARLAESCGIDIRQSRQEESLD